MRYPPQYLKRMLRDFWGSHTPNSQKHLENLKLMTILSHQKIYKGGVQVSTE